MELLLSGSRLLLPLFFRGRSPRDGAFMEGAETWSLLCGVPKARLSNSVKPSGSDDPGGVVVLWVITVLVGL